MPGRRPSVRRADGASFAASRSTFRWQPSRGNHHGAVDHACVDGGLRGSRNPKERSPVDVTDREFDGDLFLRLVDDGTLVLEPADADRVIAKLERALAAVT